MNLPFLIVCVYLLISILINIDRIGVTRVKTQFEAICDTIEYVILIGLIYWAVIIGL